MSESQFNERVDATLLRIEEAIDECGVDADYENVAGILTVTFERDDSQVIVNRQGAAGQLWVAARNGGHHFDYDERLGWVRDRDGATLGAVLDQAFSAHAATAVSLGL